MIINWKVFGRKLLWPSRDIIPALACGTEERHGKTQLESNTSGMQYVNKHIRNAVRKYISNTDIRRSDCDLPKIARYG
jgi:hypothetical protein